VHVLNVHKAHRNGEAQRCEAHHRGTSIEEQASEAPEASSVRNDPGLQRLPLLPGLLCPLPPDCVGPSEVRNAAPALPLPPPRRFFLRGCSPPAAFLRLPPLLRPQLLFSLPESGLLLLFHPQPHVLRPAALLR
jgi:hypothetical protein